MLNPIALGVWQREGMGKRDAWLEVTSDMLSKLRKCTQSMHAALRNELLSTAQNSVRLSIWYDCELARCIPAIKDNTATSLLSTSQNTVSCSEWCTTQE